MADRSFDGLSNKFSQHIYATDKGRLRLALLEEDLFNQGPDWNQPLDILDAGGGMGQLSARLAGQGHRITLCDISAEMLAGARSNFAEQAPAAEPRFLQAAIQDLPQLLAGHDYDLVLFHAVMEWLQQPYQALQQLLELLRPGGHLSVMFYNRHALNWRYLTSNQFALAMQEQVQTKPDSLTPPGPLDPYEVAAWLEQAGLNMKAWTGIRCVYDHVPRPLKPKLDYDEVLQTERHFARRPPYRELGRYVHMLVQKPD
ncbi:methyltransferase domain-containing protein [Balneatrix alpica]|uniref:tRNA 5-carboxymethoxyuridine methyltransferase n=1 Tax=Balneatrix alpica TaxID=75684 RepID=A0ABV5Z9Z6_9GAMM|nr:methyltransferase domain-containing protein [Balneatrix alpica]